MKAESESELAGRVRAAIRDVQDFPKPGINFKDITPVLADPVLFSDIIADMTALHRGAVDVVVGIESRGFIFGAPLALHLGASFIPIRKPGKLPHRTRRVDYQLEYGTDSLEAHEDAIAGGQRVVVVDDVLATGGTAAAAIELVRNLGGEVAGVSFLLELGFLNGRTRLGDVPVYSVVRY